jgi:type IV pilus assembly protein PilQ
MNLLKYAALFLLFGVFLNARGQNGTSAGNIPAATNQYGAGNFAVVTAANSVTSISSTQAGSSTIVKIITALPLSQVPRGFATGNPGRISLDLPPMSHNYGRSAIELSQGDVRSVNLVQSPERLRVVLNLKRNAGYASNIRGTELLITIDSQGNASAANTQTSLGISNAAVQIAGAKPTLRELDFRRGAEGSGRIVFELGNKDTNVDVKQKGQTVVVDLLKTDLPEHLRKRLDVVDFGTPVQTISAFKTGDTTRIVIEPKGTWEHSAYQTETQLVVEVKPIKEDPNKLTQGTRGYKGEKLSLNFQNIEVRAILQVIADFTNLNVVTSDTVAGSLTLRLKDVPWDQALDIIMQSKGLDMRKNGSVLWIAPKDEMAAKEKVELEARALLADLEPLKAQVFQLNYQKAEDVKKMLTETQSTGVGVGAAGTAQRMLSKRGTATSDNRTNQLFVQDIGSKLEDVQKLLARIDIPIRQVLIEARIVEANDQFSKNLGVKLGFNDKSGTIYNSVTRPDGTVVNYPTYQAGYGVPGGSNRILLAGNSGSAADLSSQNGSTVSGTNAVGLGQGNSSNFLSFPAAAIGGVSPASFAVSLFGSAFSRFINLEISALEADGKGKIIASPRVVTADQVKALIEQGTELPYSTTAPNGATTVAFRKANLKLEVTPQITPEGNIILDVDINKDSVGQVTAAGFAIDTKHVKTQGVYA